MKCPKCGFVSFDHNEACPKCGSDLSREREAMHLPPYQPKPLFLLGVLTTAGDMDAVGAADGRSAPSAASEGESDDLLISLDTLSDEDQEPAQYVPEASVTVPEAPMETETEGVEEELTISPDDRSGEGPDLVLFDSESEPAVSEPETLEEMVFEPETLSDNESVKAGFWEGQAMEPEEREGPISDTPSINGALSDEKGIIVQEKQSEPELLELELEPLELDPDTNESDKKTS